MDPVKTLKLIPLFETVPEDDLKDIWSQMTPVDYPAGTVILEEKGGAAGFFLLTNGSRPSPRSSSMPRQVLVFF